MRDKGKKRVCTVVTCEFYSGKSKGSGSRTLRVRDGFEVRCAQTCLRAMCTNAGAAQIHV